MYSSKKYLEIFDTKLNAENVSSLEEAIREIRSRNIFRYRIKTIKSGDILECEIYPVWIRKSEVQKAKKEKESRKEQKNLNDKNSKKRLIRKINTNFTNKDIFLTLTYDGENPTMEDAQKDIRNYIRRISHYRKKNNLEELKYIYVIEGVAESSKKRTHLHLIVNDMDRDELEKLWGKGRANSHRLQADEYGFEALARYISKETKVNKKKWVGSKNLKDPIVSIADHKISKRQTYKLAKNEIEHKEKFEALYPGYGFKGSEVYINEMISGAYIHVRMKKVGG